MILHAGLIGFYAPTNQQLIDKSAADHIAMLDRWSVSAFNFAADGNERRAEYVSHMIERGS